MAKKSNKKTNKDVMYDSAAANIGIENNETKKTEEELEKEKLLKLGIVHVKKNS